LACPFLNIFFFVVFFFFFFLFLTGGGGGGGAVDSPVKRSGMLVGKFEKSI